MSKIPFSRVHTDNGHLDAVQTAQARTARAVNNMPFSGGTALVNQVLPGLRGRVQAISGTTLTLWNPADATNFPRGLVVEASATDGTTGTKRAGSAVVSDASAGTVTASIAWATAIPGIAAGDFLFGQNEFGPAVRDPSSLAVPHFTSGPVIEVVVPGVRAGGVLVTRVSGSQAPALRTLAVFPSQGSPGTRIFFESRYASVADLWIF